MPQRPSFLINGLYGKVFVDVTGLFIYLLGTGMYSLMQYSSRHDAVAVLQTPKAGQSWTFCQSPSMRQHAPVQCIETLVPISRIIGREKS